MSEDHKDSQQDVNSLGRPAGLVDYTQSVLHGGLPDGNAEDSIGTESLPSSNPPAPDSKIWIGSYPFQNYPPEQTPITQILRTSEEKLAPYFGANAVETHDDRDEEIIRANRLIRNLCRLLSMADRHIPSNCNTMPETYTTPGRIEVDQMVRQSWKSAQQHFGIDVESPIN